MKIISDKGLAWILLVLLALIWGSSFILIKVGLKTMEAEEVGALRIISAAVFLLPLAIYNLKNLTTKHFFLLFIIGLVGSFIPAFLFAKAQTRIDSSIAGILNALTPLFTILIGFAFFKQKINKSILWGLLLGFTGTLIITLSGGEDSGAGINYYALYVILATVLYAINLNVIKYLLPDISSVAITSTSLLLVGPIALVYLLWFTPFFTNIADSSEEHLYSVGAVVLLGVVGTALGFILFNYLVKLTQPLFTSSVTYIIPLVAVGWGVLDNEQLFAIDYIGMAAVICGVYLANKEKKVLPKNRHFT